MKFTTYQMNVFARVVDRLHTEIDIIEEELDELPKYFKTEDDKITESQLLDERIEVEEELNVVKNIFWGIKLDIKKQYNHPPYNEQDNSTETD